MKILLRNRHQYNGIKRDACLCSHISAVCIPEHYCFIFLASSQFLLPSGFPFFQVIFAMLATYPGSHYHSRHNTGSLMIVALFEHVASSFDVFDVVINYWFTKEIKTLLLQSNKLTEYLRVMPFVQEQVVAPTASATSLVIVGHSAWERLVNVPRRSAMVEYRVNHTKWREIDMWIIWKIMGWSPRFAHSFKWSANRPFGSHPQGVVVGKEGNIWIWWLPQPHTPQKGKRLWRHAPWPRSPSWYKFLTWPWAPHAVPAAGVPEERHCDFGAHRIGI